MGVWMVLVLVKYLQGATFLQQMASKYHTLRPTRAFTSVDLPAFGAPIMATKPARVAF